MPQTFHYSVDGVMVAVTLDRQPDGTLIARVGEDVYRLHAESGADSAWRLTFEDGTTLTTHAVSRGDQRYVAMNGETWTLTRVEPSATSARRSKHDPKLVCTAQMPGQIRAVQVSVGEIVERGHTLVILEAMKMELKAHAETRGRVKRVMVSVGDVVQRGKVLVELEPAE